MDMKACDKMILAIIQDDSYQDVISELNESAFHRGNAAASGGDGSDPCSLRRCRVVCPGCRQV